MLAYVFWHGPREREQAAAYERLVCAFQSSLLRSPPAGMLACACYRLADEPAWLQAPAYEDWYLIEDYASLGVLNEAAVGRGHRTSHDAAARLYGAGTAGLYALIEGDPSPQALARATLATWVSRPADDRDSLRRAELAQLLADGMQPDSGSLWRRQLVLGPAPEFCLLGVDLPSGARASRLPEGWSASGLRRELVCSG